ncbi:MAG: hypothetical protein IKI75_11945 [Lachnospiraceae bacterium]|nr:hypothetical protein [Lachnospiraceae bacterium]
MEDYENYDETWSIVKDGDILCSVNGDDDRMRSIFGFWGDMLVGMRYSDDHDLDIVSIDTEGNITLLGSVDDPIGDESMAWPELRQMESDEYGAYLLIGFYEGTGHFLASYAAIRVMPGEEYSMEVFDADAYDALSDGFPYMLVEGGGSAGVFTGEEEIYLSEYSYGDLIYRESPFSAQILNEDFIYKPEAYGMPNEYRNFIQDYAVIGEYAFICTAIGYRITEADTGWREAYAPFSMEWWVIPFAPNRCNHSTGVPTELQNIGYSFLNIWKAWPEDLTGRWDLYSTEVEGDLEYAEEGSTILEVNEDGSIILSGVNGETQVLTFEDQGQSEITYVAEDEEGREFTYYFETLIDDRLQIRAVWTDPEVKFGSATWVFHRSYETDLPYYGS